MRSFKNDYLVSAIEDAHPTQAIDPVSGMTAPDVYYNTTSKKMRYYDGTIWRNIGNTSTQETIVLAEGANGEDNDLMYCVETETVYRYESVSTLTDDNLFVLSTADAGTTRWIGVSGQYIVGDVYTQNVTGSGKEDLLVYNSAGAISRYKCLEVTGHNTTFDVPTIKIINAVTDTCIGITTATVAATSKAYIRRRGVLTMTGFNTTGATIGDIVYCDAGGEPTLAATDIQIGIVLTLSANGVVYIQFGQAKRWTSDGTTISTVGGTESIIALSGSDVGLANSSFSLIKNVGNNIFCGDDSGISGSITGLGNVGVGNETLNVVTGGSYNVAIGDGAIKANNSTHYNTGIGYFTLSSLSSGSGKNVAIGHEAGRYISAGGSLTSATNGLFIGSGTRASALSASNEVAIGYNAIASGSNTITLGGSTNTDTYVTGKLHTTDDVIVDAGGSIGIGITPTTTLHIKNQGSTTFLAIDSIASKNTRLLFMENGVTNWNLGNVHTTKQFTLFDSVNTKTPFQIEHNSPNNALKINTGDIVFNEDGEDYDFRVESDTKTNAFFVQGSSGFVGMGNASPDVKLHVGDGTTATELRLDASSGFTPATITMGAGGTKDFKMNYTGDNLNFNSMTDPFGTTGDVIFQIEIDNAQQYCLRLLGTEVVVNDGGNDINFRVEGDTLPYAFFVHADGTYENASFFTASEPNWQTMDRGLFIGNVASLPTGNPVGGGFLYVHGGALKFRGTSGTITTIAPA